MATVYHRYVSVGGHQLFYREAGPLDAPTVVLLHGYPSSSIMFRDLVPIIAERYRVIAPDHLGFGLSDAPSVDDFDYSFESLSNLTAGLLKQLGVTRYGIYVHDYGAPIGWRLAVGNPSAITSIVTQSGNGYQDGFVESFWRPVWAYSREQTPQTEGAVRGGLTLESIRWQYLTGVPEQSVVSPETWNHDFGLVSRPGNDRVQLALNRDYVNNISLYPKLHEYLRASEVPVLAIWGEGDPIFRPAGAKAFAKDSRGAEIHLLPGGHFLLESALHESAGLMMQFLDRVHLPD
jgi:pimeloyl-ACP methyl ester carboxylesterase